jgi:serine/threonine protein kinase
VGTLGRYTLLDAIGEGGMAQVFRARLDGPMGFQKELAIKRIRDSVVAQHEDGVRSLINEARIGGRLKHPNIVEVYDLGEDDGAYYIAMELVDGATVGQLLHAARDARIDLPSNVIVDVALQVCRGLQYAHQFTDRKGQLEPVVHRDLKPSNIMITRGGTVKIMDFGIAKSATNLFDTTSTGVAKGTPLYMSPEQLRGMRPLPSCSDLFSMGTIVYELVMGRLLFPGHTIPEIITRVLSMPLEQCIADADHKMKGIGPILERMLDRDVARRVRDAREVENELRHLLDWQEETVSTAEFIQDFIKRGGSFEPAVVAADTTAPPIKPDYHSTNDKPGPGQETIVRRYLRAQKQRRWLILVVLLAAVVVGGAAGAYVYRGTVGISLQADAGTAALNRGDLAGARAAWQGVVAQNPAQFDMLRRGVVVAAWEGLDEAGQADALEALSTLPEEDVDAYVSKYRTTAWLHRQRNDTRQAFLHLTWARERIRKAEADEAAALPVALLWEMGEVAVLRGAYAAAKGFFRDAAADLAPGVTRDAAEAWVEHLDRGVGELLRAELLWQAGRLTDADWGALLVQLGEDPRSRSRRDRERLVWAYRALEEERWALTLDLLRPLGALTGEPERRRSAKAAAAAAQGALGREGEAKRTLKASLEKADSAADRAASHAVVARALVRSGESEWLEELLVDLALDAGEDDPDLQRLRAQRGTDGGAEPARTKSGPPPRSWDPRSGRMFAGPWQRGGPGPTRLIPSAGWPASNLSTTGVAWPFGPTFHPLDDSTLPLACHPGR